MNHLLRLSFGIMFLLLAPWPCVPAEVDESPLAVEVVRAFPKLRLRRPVVFTHAGDGSNRVFVCTQQGVIWSFPNDQNVDEDDVTTFLDIESRVVYKDHENEEGLLGLAFHPRYRENGQFFVYYTTTDVPHVSVISRFGASDAEGRAADPDSEMELMRIPQPFWNHNGGTVDFGPDGYLYIGLGDGGSANDPLGNGQNPKTLLGSILRIDVDRQDLGRNYAIPPDNPFAQAGATVRPEIWAYGFRNVWRLAFDRETNLLWAADVGQDIWEEIDIVQRGGNYGWNLREGKHRFGDAGSGPRADLIDPIWEYHHDLGKSITGGCVYRGRQVPELVGSYLYADYVTGRFWALRYDPNTKKVLANRPIRSEGNKPIVTFGEAEDGEVYCTDSFGMIYTFREI
jgi:quinoprotein glucose dehydrogenase